MGLNFSSFAAFNAGFLQPLSGESSYSFSPFLADQFSIYSGPMHQLGFFAPSAPQVLTSPSNTASYDVLEQNDVPAKERAIVEGALKFVVNESSAEVRVSAQLSLDVIPTKATTASIDTSIENINSVKKDAAITASRISQIRSGDEQPKDDKPSASGEGSAKKTKKRQTAPSGSNDAQAANGGKVFHGRMGGRLRLRKENREGQFAAAPTKNGHSNESESPQPALSQGSKDSRESSSAGDGDELSISESISPLWYLTPKFFAVPPAVFVGGRLNVFANANSFADFSVDISDRSASAITALPYAHVAPKNVRDHAKTSADDSPALSETLTKGPTKRATFPPADEPLPLDVGEIVEPLKRARAIADYSHGVFKFSDGKASFPHFIKASKAVELVKETNEAQGPVAVQKNTSWHKTATDKIAAVMIVDDGAYSARYVRTKKGWEFAGAVFVSAAQLYILGREEGALRDKLAFDARAGWAIAMPGGETAYQQNISGEEESRRSAVAKKVLEFIARGPEQGNLGKLAEDLNGILLSRGPASVEDIITDEDAADIVAESISSAVGLVSPYDDGGARSRKDIVSTASAILRAGMDDVEGWSLQLGLDFIDVQLDRAKNGRPEYKPFVEEVIDDVRSEILPTSLGLRYAARYELLNGDVDTQWLAISMAGVADADERAELVVEFAKQLSKYAGIYVAGSFLALLVFNSELGMFAGEETPVAGPLTSKDLGRVIARFFQKGAESLIAHPAFRDQLTPVQNRELNKMTVEANYESAIEEMRRMDVAHTPYEEFMDFLDSFEDLIFGPVIEDMAAMGDKLLEVR